MNVSLKRGMVLGCLMAVIAGCSRSDSPPTSLRADLVPLKVVMTDYIVADSGRKLIKVEGSVSYVVPLASYEPRLEGRCFVYHNLPRPRLDLLSLRIDGQKLLRNERGLFTSRSSDSARINELREDAVKKMKEVAEDESFIQIAMANAKDAMKAFYEKFDGYSCLIQWK